MFGRRSIRWEKLFNEALGSSSPPISAIGWRPDGKALAVGCENGQLSLFDMESHSELPPSSTARPHSSAIRAMYWTSSQRAAPPPPVSAVGAAGAGAGADPDLPSASSAAAVAAAAAAAAAAASDLWDDSEGGVGIDPSSAPYRDRAWDLPVCCCAPLLAAARSAQPACAACTGSERRRFAASRSAASSLAPYLCTVWPKSVGLRRFILGKISFYFKNDFWELFQ